MPLDVTQALKDSENALREFIAAVLSRKLGDDWIERCGATPERVAQWKARKDTEARRQRAGVVEERLLYYADFFDLKNILKKQWDGEFSEAFGRWQEMDVWLSTLESFRDPDAHRRELLPHQKYLALGIAGQIRTLLIRYRSKQETGESYYPRIESARDNLGNIVFPNGRGPMAALEVEGALRVGDTVEWVVTASDPLGEPIRYRADYGGVRTDWQDGNEFRHTFQRSGKLLFVQLDICSPREFHASMGYDDSAFFAYEVLPPRR